LSQILTSSVQHFEMILLTLNVLNNNIQKIVSTASPEHYMMTPL